MSAKYILAIDQGTTGTTAMVVDENLRVRGKSNHEFPQVFPKPGWVEHQGNAIWQSVDAAVRGALQAAYINGKDICGIGITNQRETTCLFDQESNPLANFIVWQCRRTTDACAALKAQGVEAKVKEKTGLVLDPYFSGTKLAWLLENVEGARVSAEKGEALFGTIDSWLVHKLSGGKVHITDTTNASRTMLMNLKTLQYDDEMLELLNIPRACLPKIRSSSEVYGHTQGMGFLPDGIPIAGIAGDQQAALFGQACFEKGEAKCTYGTGCFLLMNTGDEVVYSEHGLLTTVAATVQGKTTYALEGAAFVAGAAVQWLRDGLEWIDSASEIEHHARKVSETGEVVFVPSLAGLGAPHWRPEARGLLAGFSRDTTKAHVCRAVLEGIALQNRDILVAMKKDAGTLAVLKVDGGASANGLLMQMQSDFLDVKCVRPEVIETTGLGAAALAGLSVGVFSSQEDVRSVWKEDAVFNPKMAEADKEKTLQKWQKALANA